MWVTSARAVTFAWGGSCSTLPTMHRRRHGARRALRHLRGGPGRRGGRRARNRYLVTVDLTARVPVGSRLRLCTVNGREVSVSGTAGDFEIDNVNGRITMDRISGSGRATTVNGDVRVFRVAG
ncbi:MAG: hypothetical protein O3A25_18465 [Acidobacteria bacterium]|nr:hypothetical protein [Acidobacteriota bacterium]